MYYDKSFETRSSWHWNHPRDNISRSSTRKEASEVPMYIDWRSPATASCSHAGFSAHNILDRLIYVSCLILPWPQLLQSRVLRGFNVNRLLHYTHTDTDAPQARYKPCTVHTYGGANPGRCRPGLLEDRTTSESHNTITKTKPKTRQGQGYIGTSWHTACPRIYAINNTQNSR